MGCLIRFFKSLGERWWTRLFAFGHGQSRNGLFARFLTSKSHFGAANGVIKASGFMPPTDLKLAVF